MPFRSVTSVLVAALVLAVATQAYAAGDGSLYEQTIINSNPAYYWELDDIGVNGTRGVAVDTMGNLDGEYVTLNPAGFNVFPNGFGPRTDLSGPDAPGLIGPGGEQNFAHWSNSGGPAGAGGFDRGYSHIELGDANVVSGAGAANGNPDNEITLSMWYQGQRAFGATRLFSTNGRGNDYLQVNLGNLGAGPDYGLFVATGDNGQSFRLNRVGQETDDMDNVTRGHLNEWINVVVSTMGTTPDERQENTKIWVNGRFVKDAGNSDFEDNAGWGVDTGSFDDFNDGSSIARIAGRNPIPGSAHSPDGAQDEVVIWHDYIEADGNNGFNNGFVDTLWNAATDPEGTGTNTFPSQPVQPVVIEPKAFQEAQADVGGNIRVQTLENSNQILGEGTVIEAINFGARGDGVADSIDLVTSDGTITFVTGPGATNDDLPLVSAEAATGVPQFRGGAVPDGVATNRWGIWNADFAALEVLNGHDSGAINSAPADSPVGTFGQANNIDFFDNPELFDFLETGSLLPQTGLWANAPHNADPTFQMQLPGSEQVIGETYRLQMVLNGGPGRSYFVRADGSLQYEWEDAIAEEFRVGGFFDEDGGRFAHLLTFEWTAQEDPDNPGVALDQRFDFYSGKVAEGLVSGLLLTSGVTLEDDGSGPRPIIPEPTSLAIFGLAGGLLTRRRRAA